MEQKKSLTRLKQKEIFDELANERMKEIQDLSKPVNFSNLTYHYKSKTPSKNFIAFKGRLNFYNTMRESYITLKKHKKNKNNLKMK